MALTVLMTIDPQSHAAVATISGDAGHEHLIVDIADTLSAIADTQDLVVDITDTQHLDAPRLDQLLDNTPSHVIFVHPVGGQRSRRVVASLSAARELLPIDRR